MHKGFTFVNLIEGDELVWLMGLIGITGTANHGWDVGALEQSGFGADGHLVLEPYDCPSLGRSLGRGGSPPAGLSRRWDNTPLTAVHQRSAVFFIWNCGRSRQRSQSLGTVAGHDRAFQPTTGNRRP